MAAQGYDAKLSPQEILNRVFDTSNNSLNTGATGGGGGASTIADGADVAEGATTDSAASAGGTGTISAKLRKISTDINTISTRTLTSKTAYGSYTAMTVTNLQSLASSATGGWQSARVDNQTSVNALDYEIFVKLTTANTAPGSDKAAYVYISPAITTDGGTTWLHADQGTTTLPTGTEGTTTIASPNNLKLLGVLSYTTQQMVMQGSFNLSNAVGRSMPDGFSIIIINFSGAALSTSCVVAYRAITNTVA